MLVDWRIYTWYCPNCKEEVAGLKNKKNQIKVKCSRCGAEMIRTVVGRRHDVIDIYVSLTELPMNSARSYSRKSAKSLTIIMSMTMKRMTLPI